MDNILGRSLRYNADTSLSDALPLAVSFSVEDISGKFAFNVSNDCILNLPLDTDPSVILDVTCEMGWPDTKYPFYEGDYVVDPRKVSQVLPTKEKSMANDLQVNSIYYSKVSNESGGNTIFIGKE